MTQDNSPIGHNSDGKLRSFVDRLKRLEDDKANLMEDMREVIKEAKGEGYDGPTLRRIVRFERMDQNKRREQRDLLEAYLSALGDFADTPLGEAGRPR